MQDLNFMKIIYSLYKSIATRGFILPLTMLICTIVLLISSGITNILAKEVYFSRLSRQSQLAYYAADTGVMCAIMIDDKYLDPNTGSGIFPFNQLIDPATSMQNTMTEVNLERQSKNLSTLSLNNITCATSPIFDATLSNFSTTAFSRVNSIGVTENGWASSYSMRMDLGDGTFRCANVTVNKTSNYRQIISRGYANCLANSLQQVERAIVNTTE